MIYGRFTHTEWEQRGDNPYIEWNGKPYRITEVARNIADVRYQAVEVEPREVEAWRQAQTWRSKAFEPDEPEAPAPVPASPESDDDSGSEAKRVDPRIMEKLEQASANPATARKTLTMRQFAAQKGHRTGRWPKTLKAEYDHYLNDREE